MQNVENDKPTYEFMDTNMFELQQYYDLNTEEVDRLVRELDSCEAVKYIDTLSIFTNILCECKKLWTSIENFANKNNNVTVLVLDQYKCNGSWYSIDIIITILELFKNVEDVSLNLSNTDYNDDEIGALGKYFDRQTNINTLKLQSKYGTIFKIIEYIKYNESVTDIELTIDGMERIKSTSQVPVTPKITKINILDCTIHHNYETAFNTYLEKLLTNPNITELSLRNVNINTDTVTIISDFIKNNEVLTSLYLEQCDLNDEQIGIITRATEISNIENLTIIDNEFNDADCIVNLLKSTKSLKYVNMSNYSIKYEQFIEILKALAQNSTINTFHCLDIDNVGDETYDKIVKTMEKILSDNYAIVDFCVFIFIGREEKLTELKNITDRNKEAIIKSRFVRTKVADNQI